MRSLTYAYKESQIDLAGLGTTVGFKKSNMAWHYSKNKNILKAAGFYDGGGATKDNVIATTEGDDAEPSSGKKRKSQIKESGKERKPRAKKAKVNEAEDGDEDDVSKVKTENMIDEGVAMGAVAGDEA